MKRASEILTAAEKAAIETAIAQAERATSAEIVVVVATRSGSYDRAEDIFGVLLACLAVAGAWWLWQGLQPNPGAWESGTIPALGLVAVLAIFVAWTVLGAVLATWVPALARPFIGKRHLEAEVRRRGLEAFHSFKLAGTRGRSGVLIFVSLFERITWVAGDDAVSASVPHEEWDAACRTITTGFRVKKGGSALAEAVGMCGQVLARHVPRAPDDREELPNTVHFMD